MRDTVFAMLTVKHMGWIWAISDNGHYVKLWIGEKNYPPLHIVVQPLSNHNEFCERDSPERTPLLGIITYLFSSVKKRLTGIKTVLDASFIVAAVNRGLHNGDEELYGLHKYIIHEKCCII